MALKLRQFTREFKLQFLQEADSGKSVSQLAREHHVHSALDPSLVTTACPATQAQATSNRITLVSWPEIFSCLRPLEMNDKVQLKKIRTTTVPEIYSRVRYV